ncbi:patatin-like phospholipase family protein [Rubrolithibacter danxiaensis]|uniref:patatin-like phospholipase family protein n=1 Tax=Rubrolithibacter danxiaensis TaxID=3390805 RepID=UPI003BF80769
MEAVQDLAARAISFIGLIQDIVIKINAELPEKNFLKLTSTPSDFIINELQDYIINEKNKNTKKRLVELLLIKDQTARPKIAVAYFITMVAPLLKWLREKEEVQNLLKDEPATYPSMHDWREVIRTILYAEPTERLELCNILHYLPIIIVLALGGGENNASEQRAFQLWNVPAAVAETLLPKREFNKWEKWQSEIGDNAEKLLLDQQYLMTELVQKEIPLPFEFVFLEELKEIVKSRKKRLSSPEKQDEEHFLPDNPVQKAENMNLFALAFSGGGIRSATFNLGVLQAFAKADILPKIDYLSTVSGGGYIGSWLAAWIKREGTVPEVESCLNPDESRNPFGEEVRPIRWLRMYSNYLSPNSSIMSIDAWTMGLTWIRNTLLNQVIIIFLFAAALSTGAILFYTWDFYIVWPDARESGKVWVWSLGLLLAGAVLAGWGMSAFNSRKLFPGSPLSRDQSATLIFCLTLLTFLTAYLTSGWLFSRSYIHIADSGRIPFAEKIDILKPAALVGFFALLLVAILGRYDQCLPDTGEYKLLLKKVLAYIYIIVASAVAAITGLIAMAIVWHFIEYIAQHAYRSEFLTDRLTHRFYTGMAFCLGIPLVLEVITLTVITRMGMLGPFFPDERREWWGRVGAVVHRIAFLWIIITGTALLSGEFMLYAYRRWKPEFITITGGWAAIVGAAVKLAFSSKTSGDKKSGNKMASFLDIVVRGAPYFFGFGLLILLSTLVHWILIHLWGTAVPDASWKNMWNDSSEKINSAILWSLFCAGIFIGATCILAYTVGVNEFSMHHFYRNRLARAYLAASRRRAERSKTVNPFTRFDNNQDDIKLHELQTKEGYYGPYPILNTALNATQVSQLDRQDRQAESFTFSPLYCGFDFNRNRASADSKNKSYDYAYRPTGNYAYPNGPALGTAMAISGAAANPNQGYHSSSATAFLMTLFNVRLGWWIGNPRRKTWKKADPAFGIAYLIADLIGKSNTDDLYVCLSDGGHFDNMGLYELVRRRCRYIILSDAEQDAKFTCEGLANALRRCRIDFGVEIRIDVSDITKRDPETGFSSKYFTWGTILYPEDPVDSPSGILVYIKSSLTGRKEESVDLREYAIANPSFPHQTTGDQFFDESQFESYRKLGFTAGEAAITDPGVRKVLKLS